MKNSNTKGYATLLTIITIGLLGIVILGLLNLHSLNHKMIQSNECSIKAYYLGESGIAVLKNEIDTAFEKHFNEYLYYLTSEEDVETLETAEEKDLQSYKDYVMMQEEIRDLLEVRIEENVFGFYEDPHGWRLEVDFEDAITLYATGHYKKAQKRMVTIISYPDILALNEVDGIEEYRFLASKILVYYQGYEGEHID